MKLQMEEKLSQFLIITGTVLTALLITPFYSSEPVDLPKLFVMAPFAFAILGVMAGNWKLYYSKQYRVVTTLVSVFVIQLVLVLFFSRSVLTEQFYGTTGRNTGFLAYLSLALLLLGSVGISSSKFIRLLALSVLFTGVISLFYALLQTSGNDPVKWNNPYNPIISFLGNPDFASSFLGISASLAISLILTKATRISIKVFLVVFLVVDLFVIKRSHAQQGILVFGIIFVLSIGIWLFKSEGKLAKLAPIYASVAGILGLLVALGPFKVGPLGPYLYKYSVRQRGFYWHAAIEMVKKNPIFGVGLDSYGDNYFKYRSANAAFFSGPIQSNTAHNVFLDIASNGGLVLILTYICINIYALYAAVKIFKNSKNFDPYFTAVFTGWVGYQAQSIASINQLGLAVWGWVLSGAIIGFYLNNLRPKVESNSGSKRVVRKNTSNTSILATLGLIIGFLFSFPAFMNDHNYRQAFTTRNATNVIGATLKSPESLNRTISTAQQLASSKFYKQALDLLNHVVKKNPDSYNAWSLISQLSLPNSTERNTAIKNMKRLNPHDKSIN